MNKKFYLIGTLLSLFLATLFLGSCKKEQGSSGITEEESYELNLNSKTKTSVSDIISNPISLTISLSDKKVVKDADGMVVNLTFTGEAVKSDGSKASITGDNFDGYSKTVTIAKGENSKTISLTLKDAKSYQSLTGSFKISSRGVQIKASTVTVDMFSKIPLSLMVNNAKLVGTDPVSIVSTGSFNIGFSVAKAVSEDLEITVSRNEAAKVDMTDFPASLTIKNGQTSVASKNITATIKSGVVDAAVPVTLTFTIKSPKYELSAATLVVNVTSPTAGLTEANKLTDERWVYPFSDEVFVSSANKAAVEAWIKGTKKIKLMNPGDAHPNADLAKEGWKFRNSLEFSPIDALTKGGKENAYKNREPKYTGEQNVGGAQEFQGVYNDRWTNMDSNGNMVIWTSKGDNVFANWWSKGNNKAPQGKKDYGVGAIFMNKFRNDAEGTYKWAPNTVPIMPGTRVEIRMRCAGEIYNLNPAIWFQGNTENKDPWPYYGEIDLLEAPQGETKGRPYQTFHWGYNKSGDIGHQNPNTGALDVDVKKYNIYWLEWIDNSTVALGINGKETIRITAAQYNGGHWPFTSDYLKAGLHLLFTFSPLGTQKWGDAVGNTKPYDFYLKTIEYNGSKTNPKTPRMEVDYIRYYTKDNYKAGQYPNDVKNTPMY